MFLRGTGFVLAMIAMAPAIAQSQEVLTSPAQAPGIELVGTTLRARRPDGSYLEGRALVGAVLSVGVSGRSLRIRIAGVEPDEADPRGEVLLYDFRVVAPGGEHPLCTRAPDGRQGGIPIAGRSDPAGFLTPGNAEDFELVCASGPQGKCLRFGYGPWREAPDGTPLRDWYNACVRLFRGDYCGEGQPYTRDGTWIDFYDTLGIQKTDGDPTLRFEAGWGPQGAVCVARPRIPDLATLDSLVAACPRLKDRVGEMCTEERARSLGARLFNRSRP